MCVCACVRLYVHVCGACSLAMRVYVNVCVSAYFRMRACEWERVTVCRHTMVKFIHYAQFLTDDLFRSQITEVQVDLFGVYLLVHLSYRGRRPRLGKLHGRAGSSRPRHLGHAINARTLVQLRQELLREVRFLPLDIIAMQQKHTAFMSCTV